MTTRDSTLYMLPMLGACDADSNPPVLETKLQEGIDQELCAVAKQTSEKNLQLTPSFMRGFLEACATSLSSKFKS